LLQALRQCDGGHVQCVLLVRDDFWMSLIRFLRELEVPLREGENSAAVDRFDVPHARRVLAAFGRAYGALPEGEPSVEQKQFLDQAVSGLARDGEVVPVRLSLFAEMVKGKPWAPATLESVGGAKGIGVLFLEESFAAPTAPPEQRLHQKAARSVLEALLPEAGSGIRGRLQPRRKLLEVSGYAERPRDFAELLHILDTRLRLITPTEPEQTSGESPAGVNEVYYQLAHDYLVEPLRRWLTSKQRETLRGRAELRLADRAALWSARTERRHLPSLWGWLDALLWTRRDSWTASQWRMMRAAGRWHAFRAAVLLLLFTALCFFGATGWKEFRARSDAALGQSAVERLLHAETAELPRLLADFDRHRRVAEPLLRIAADDPARTPRERLHAGLALLPNDPDQAGPLATAAFTADAEEIPVLADALRRFHVQLSDDYWQTLQDLQDSPDRRLRAACMLAAFNPDHARWESVSATIAADLVAEKNPLHASQWMQSLRPIRRWLVPSLTNLFRDGAAPERSRSFIASILADYTEDTNLLADLILEADQRSFVLLLESLKRDRPRAVQRLTEELTREPKADWNDPPGDRSAPNRAAQEALESAHGMLTDQFAFCQTLPLSDLESLARELSRAGYRPSCFRPFDTPEGPRAAVIWLRDGRSSEWVRGMTAEELRQKDAAFRQKGLLPVDLACLVETGTAHSFAALWAAPGADLADAALYVEVSDARHEGYWKPLNNQGFVPRSNLLTFDLHGQRMNSSIRWKFRSTGAEYLDNWDASTAEYDRLLAAGWYQADVRVASSAGNKEPRYAGVWWNGRAGRESRECHGLTPAEQKQRCRQMMAEGFRPAVLSAAWNAAANRFETASVWHRPIPIEKSREELAQRQARAATALLQLGESSAVWPLLVRTPQPRVRGWLIHLLARTDTDPGLLLDRLAVEQDVSARCALLLALAEYSGGGAQSGDRTPAREGAPAREEDAPARAAGRADAIAARAAELYRGDPDPGVHSAAAFLLQRFGRAKQLAELDDALSHEPPAGDRRWFRNSQGQTFAVLRGPVEFQFGSPGDEPGHIQYSELRHRVRIPRGFAISTTEVTIEQFLRFRHDHPVDPKYTPDRSCPVTNVTWFEAVAYCLWLSEQEGIAEDQRCYPTLDQIGPGMTLPADFLDRTGYRLATEAEWEYACRAKTLTSRYFGNSNILLPSYAWTPDALWWKGSPVARLMPNDFGLFDTLGNAMEWCHDRYRIHPFLPGDQCREDTFGEEVVGDADEREDSRVRRGGSFLHQPDDARAPQRDWGRPSNRHPFQGFRIVRTVK
jgi:formylglycine-generating enzyme required for sulfatase activity